MKKELIINLIQQLYCNGITRTQIAAGFGVGPETIRRYSLGKIPEKKEDAFINFVRQNYREVYEYVEHTEI